MVAKQNQKAKQKAPVSVGVAGNAKVVAQLRGWPVYLLIFLFSCMLYSNTLFNNYAIDDAVVLTDNRFTKKGFGGIKDHFTHDMFEGFYGEQGARQVNGGRYRPLSMAVLSVEYEITRKIRGDKRDAITDKDIIIGSDHDPYLMPMLSHGINILLFGLTCALLYYILLQLIPVKYSITTRIGLLGMPFFATLLYASHPMHTEAVANIKGRDEIMCMFFSLLALLAALRYVSTGKAVNLVWGMFIYFLALLSKENAITFLAVVPLTYFFFTTAKAKDYAMALGAYLVPVIVFLLLRGTFTQTGVFQASSEILNNPFVLATGAQRFATTILTFLYYFKLLVFPHPLTHDYFFNQIPYVDFSSPLVLLSISINAGLLVYAVVKLKSKSIAAYAILFYFITFSIASNMFFTVGVLMNERFIYVSSLGFCILLAYLLIQSKNRFKLSPDLILGVFVAVLLLYSAKTFSRNFAWKDNLTLFTTDIVQSPNSAKIQRSVGDVLNSEADGNIAALRDSGIIKKVMSNLSGGTKTETELNTINALPDSSIRRLLLDSAIAHYYRATDIYKTNASYWQLLGNALFKRDHNADEAIPVYEKASALQPEGSYDIYFNLGLVYNQSNQAQKAKQNLLKAIAFKPNAFECRIMLAHAYAKLNQPDSVAYWVNRANQIKEVGAFDYWYY